MKSLTKRRIKTFILLILFYLSPLIIMGFINMPPKQFIDDETASGLKYLFTAFSVSHQNPQNGLYIGPTIDHNYRAIDSINFSDANDVQLFNNYLIDPRNNSYISKIFPSFFYEYLWARQNNNTFCI